MAAGAWSASAGWRWRRCSNNDSAPVASSSAKTDAVWPRIRARSPARSRSLWIGPGSLGSGFTTSVYITATVLLEAGAHPNLVQDLLGPSTVTLTPNTYNHVM